MRPVPIYTIGYGSRDMEAFVAVLKQYGITYLIDVRSRPYSRYKPEFSKKALEQSLKGEGISYIFMGDSLGGQPDDPDCYTDGKVDYEKLRRQAAYREGIGRLQEAYRQQVPVALMCSEGKPEECHRTKLIARSLAAHEIEVAHIDESDQLLNQEEVFLRLSKGQPSLFGDEFHRFTSRKRYRPDQDEP